MAVPSHKKSSYDEGSLDQYLRDISAYPLIDRDEEVRLAQLIRVKDAEEALRVANDTDTRWIELSSYPVAARRPVATSSRRAATARASVSVARCRRTRPSTA